jgi:hypothetical protein
VCVSSPDHCCDRSPGTAWHWLAVRITHVRCGLHPPAPSPGRPWSAA